MKPISKYLAALVFSLTFVFVAGFTSPQAQAQIAQSCGCGSPKCGGCLKGKLFPKQLASLRKPVKNCNCEACQQAAPVASQPVVTSDVLVSTEYLPEVVVQPCGCGQTPCRCRLRPKRTRTRNCPECDCDFCELKVEKTKEKKTCFEVKQKEVCVPAVTLPWKKNCPPTRSKVRVVNVLSKKTYECPSCSYEWKVYEPDVPEAPASESKSDSLFGSADKKSESAPVKEVDPVAPSAPKMNVPEPPDVNKLKLDSVPRPPVEKDA